MEEPLWKHMTTEQWRAMCDAAGLLVNTMAAQVGPEHPVCYRLRGALKAAFEHLEWMYDEAAKEARPS
jgi:hypothetical protein